MSVELVKEAMLKFLNDPEPSVLCIKGKWGTGKTYAWDAAVKQAAATKQMPMKKYAYLSLFGIKESSDIFQSVFANTVDFPGLNEGKRLPDKFGGLQLDKLYKKVKALPAFASEHAAIPYISGLAGVARAVLSNLVSNTVVCIDDFERKSKNVGINEIMGTVAQLRDGRRCKVVLILNENSLDEEEQAEFHRYAEKVINKEFMFNPSPEDSAKIAFPGSDSLSQSLRESCSELGIINIRVMTRIGSFARELEKLIVGIDDSIRKNVIRSLVVLVWSIASPIGEGAARLDYLVQKRRDQYFGIKKIQFTEEESACGILLTEYGFTGCDEFELLMIDDIQNGFFNEKNIRGGVEKFLSDAKKARSNANIEAAWKPFHGSFDDNSEEVAKSIFDGCVTNIEFLTPMALDAAVSLLKNISFKARADELLNQYIVTHDGSTIFDGSHPIFRSNFTDPDVTKAFEDRVRQSARFLPTPLEAASRIYKGGWSPEDEESLVKLSVDDLVALFKEARASDQSILILGCLEFRKFSSASSVQKDIAANALAALHRIGKESLLNAARLKAFGIDISAITEPTTPKTEQD
jgi:hypothetical protein